VGRRTRTWIARLAFVACALALVVQCALPVVVERGVRGQLAEAGYADARFRVSAAQLHRLVLADVTLHDGLELGDVEIEGGLLGLARDTTLDVTLHGPRVDATALSGLPEPRHRGRRDRALGRVRVTRGELRSGDQAIAIDGTIDLARDTVDLMASTPRLAIAGGELREVVARVRGSRDALRTCATGTLGAGRGTQLEACTTTSLAKLRTGAFDVRWTARGGDDTWRASGRGKLRLADATLAVERGRVELALSDGMRITAEVAGTLDALSATGMMRTRQLEIGSATLREVTLPFTGRGRVRAGRLEMASEAPVVAHAWGGSLQLANSTLPFDDSTITAAGRLALADGAIVLAAGEAPRDELELELQVRGVALDPFLAHATSGEVRGTGLLDGRVGLSLAGDAWSIRGGALSARGGGKLAITAAAIDAGGKLEERVLGTLADFAYRRLAIAVGQGGRDPQLRLELAGRGRRIPQELTVVLNLRGITQRLARTL
jgi:hypothetical protein